MVSIFFGSQAVSHSRSGDSKNKKKKVPCDTLIFSCHIPLEACAIIQCYPLLKHAEIMDWCSLFYIHGREFHQDLTSFDLKSAVFPNDMI
jgi:hypothetical protein